MTLSHIDLEPQLAMRNPSDRAPHSVLDEMESEFLIYLLERFQPKKMVEIGVGRGGTSATILKNTSQNQYLYGVDIASKPVNNFPIGHVVQDECDQSQKDRYTLYTGKDAVEVMPMIGGEIDFAYIDTTHALPGELLQFFAVYKYMRPGAVLLLHDLALNSFPFTAKNYNYRREACSTKILFCALASRQKFIPDSPLPNIGAILIDDLTKENIESTFMALSITWFYYPKDVLSKFKGFIENNYSSFCAEYFNKCLEMQKRLHDYNN